MSDDVGNKLRFYRALRRMSAQQVSDATNGQVTRAVIANIESGRKADVTVRELAHLAYALEVPAVALAPVLDPASANEHLASVLLREQMEDTKSE